MAWNDQGNGRNPWDSGGNGPPDLDQIVREWQQRFSRLFGGGGGSNGEGGGGSGLGALGGTMIAAALAIVVAGWAATGLYRVDDAERGIVLRFGDFRSATLPGLRWHIPWPVESVELVNVNAVDRFNQQTRMLTSDENIVVVDLVVQFRRADPEAYLFNVRDPDATLSDISESAIREVVGKNSMDFILLEGRAEIAQRTQDLIQQTLDEYGAGIVVTKVNLQNANFPSQVEAAVQDAIKAREDRERLAFEAQSYANDIVPRARGEAARRVLDAEAYRARVLADAQGEASRFEQLLTEYEKAPVVTRERLYIEAIEQVYGNATKILLDAEGSGNLLYLPVDKLIESQGQSSQSGQTPRGSQAQPGVRLSDPDNIDRNDPRARRSR